jgi:hypothetical protein
VQEGILDKEQDGSASLKQLQASDVGTQLYDESGLKEKKIKHTMKPIVADNRGQLVRPTIYLCFGHGTNRSTTPGHDSSMR